MFNRVSVSALCHRVSSKIALPGIIVEIDILFPTAANLWFTTKATPRALGLLGSGEAKTDRWANKSFICSLCS